MVFSSIPSYLDPSNWHNHQQQQQQLQLQHQQNQGGFHHGINLIPSLTNPNPLLPLPPLPPPQHPRAQPPAQSSPSSLPPGPIRPGSMAERARMANIPMPEMALKCPRCESTNTKFCYFNNYSLSQPRHFCKTCRRYWTRGGALRTVPVGGGCRRNKRSKSSSSSKSAATSSSTTTSSATSSSSIAEIMGLTSPPPGLSPLRFMSPLHHMTSDFGEQLGLSGYVEEPWRFPTPFLGPSLFGGSFQAVDAEVVKMEERGGEMSLVRRFNMGISNNDNNGGTQGNVGEGNYNWGVGTSSSGNAWTDQLNSAINNSSCSNTSAL